MTKSDKYDRITTSTKEEKKLEERDAKASEEQKKIEAGDVKASKEQRNKGRLKHESLQNTKEDQNTEEPKIQKKIEVRKNLKHERKL